MSSRSYPAVLAAELVGTYPASAKAGGGYVWDEVLEYRVWCHPADGGDDYYYPFDTAAEAIAFSEGTKGAEEPLALILPGDPWTRRPGPRVLDEDRRE